MTTPTTMDQWLAESHDMLRDRLAEAERQWQPPTTTGDARTATDGFCVAAAQHLAGFAEVVLPLADRSARPAYVAASKRLEMLLAFAKGRAYGQGQSMRQRWPALWSEVEHDLATTLTLESGIVAELPSDAAATGERLAAAVAHAPTRPHPHLPHTGTTGHVTRAVVAHTDRVWDELQGRVTGRPRRSDRKHSGWNWRMSV